MTNPTKSSGSAAVMTAWIVIRSIYKRGMHTFPRLLSGRSPQAVGIALAVFAFGLVATGLAAFLVRESVVIEASSRMDDHAVRLETEITSRIVRAEYGLRGALASYASTGVLDRHTFRAYVQARRLDMEFPGIRGFGFIEHVRRADLGRFLREQRAEEPAFNVRSQGDRDLYVIKYLEPASRNGAALGYDVGSEPVRREAVERAIRTGETALTGVVTLLQDERRGPGWLMFVPAFSWPAATPAERELALAGLFYAPIIASEVLGNLSAFLDDEVDFLLYDQDASQPLFDSRTDERRSVAPQFVKTRVLSIGGRDHVLRVHSTDKLSGGVRGHMHRTVGAVGMLLSGLIAWAAWLLVSGRSRAVALAESMTADLRRLAVVVEHTSNAVVGLDLELRVLWINAGFTRMTGWTPDECVGRHISEVLRHPDGCRVARGLLREAAANRQSCRVEQLNRHRNGHGIWMDIEIQPTIDQHGRLTGWIEIAVDVTELRQARDAAIDASQAKSRFLSSVSHELRTPMNAVLGMLTLVQRTALPPRQLDYVQKAHAAARSLLDLLNDVLDLAKVESGKMTLHPRAFSLEDLLRELSVLLGVQVGDKDVELVFRIDPRLPRMLLADDLRLRQIVTNLCSNAIKFTSRGSVEVAVTVLRATRDGVVLRLSVCDTGIGMDPEERRKLFGEFMQANAATAARFGGTGLGLNICQRFAALMDSRIQVESEPGQGSRFWLDLCMPVVEPAGTTEPAPAGRALLVEPHDAARSAMAAQLAQIGWAVSAFPTMPDTMPLADGSGAWDVVVLPSQCVEQALERLRRAALSEQRPPRLLVLRRVGVAYEDHAASLSGSGIQVLDVSKPTTASTFAAILAADPEPAVAPSRHAQGSALRGMRLLLAEDNAINQQIARELLEGQGASMTLVPDGAQAVACVARTPDAYDLVLMDLQMPVMDGVAATKAIRAIAAAEGLPIVAMTANALEHDRQACMAAGMVDHVGKPFDLDQLVAVISRHARGGRPAVEACWDREAALSSMGGSADLLGRVLTLFQERLPGVADELRGLVAADDLKAAARLLHTLRGQAGTFCAQPLLRVTERLEADLQAGHASGPGWSGHVDDLEHELTRLAAAMAPA
jgi:PAS domain S-box-containing protein